MKDDTRRSPALRRVLFAIVSIAVTIGVMGYLLNRHPPRELLRTALDIDRRGILCFVVLSLAQLLFRTWRYQLLLRHAGVFVGNLAMTLATLIRNLFSDLLPARIGSLSYVWVATQRLGVPLESATSSFAVAFIFDLVVVAPMVLAALAFAGGVGNLPVRTIAVSGVLVLLVLLLVLVFLARLMKSAARLLGKSKGRLGALSGKLADAGDQVASLRKGGIYWRVLLLSIFVRTCKYGAMYFLVFAVLEPFGYTLSDLPVSRVFLGMSAGELAASTPFSGVAGFGAYEGAWSGMFTALGFPRDLSEASSIIHHVLTQAWGYGLGAFALIVILLPVFRKPGIEGSAPSSARTSNGLAFAGKVLGAFIITALLVAGIIESSRLLADDLIAADRPTPAQISGREELAKRLGGSVVFDSNRSGSFGIWTARLDGKGLRAIADSDGDEMFPAVSPDGQRVAYAKYRRYGDRAPSDIWVAGLDGSGARILADDGTFPYWSADGGKLYFQRDRSRLMALDLDSGRIEELLPRLAPEFSSYEIIKPRVSADGRYAAFISDRKGRWNVWIADLENHGTIHVGEGCEPAWIGNSNALVWVSGHPPDTSIRRFDLATGEISVIVDDREARPMEYFPSVTADGSYVFYSSAPGAGKAGHESANYQIHVKPLGGEETVRLTFDKFTNRWPVHVPD